MLDAWPDQARRPAGGGASRITATYVEVASEDGAKGLFGPVFEETAAVILAKLKPWVVGSDVFAYERTWDLMYRQDRHSRKGYEMMAISAVDNALWDLRGKLRGEPIHRLLGGPTRDRIDCYASTLGFSHEPSKVRERAQWAKAEGFK